MAKYSVNSRSDSKSTTEKASGGFCERCGAEVEYLHQEEIAGAVLDLCTDCSPKDHSSDTTNNSSETTPKSTKDLVNETTSDTDTVMPDSSWAESGLDYEGDSKIPYLVRDYGSKVIAERESQDISQEELAEQLGVGVNLIRVIEQNQATQENIGVELIEDLEDLFEITLREDV